MNAAPKHTPGPWRLEPGPLGWYIYSDSHVGPIACMYSRLDLPGHFPEAAEQRDANARLVVAAPELLEALELLTVDVNGDAWVESSVEDSEWDRRREEGRKKAFELFARISEGAA